MGKDKLRHPRKEKGKVRGLDVSRVSLRTASRPVSSLGERGSYRKHGRNLLYLRKEESKGKAYPQSSRGLNWVRAPSLDLSVPPSTGAGTVFRRWKLRNRRKKGFGEAGKPKVEQ